MLTASFDPKLLPIANSNKYGMFDGVFLKYKFIFEQVYTIHHSCPVNIAQTTMYDQIMVDLTFKG